MAPKKAKKTKAEIEAEKLAKEEEERKEQAALEKRLLEEAEKRRLEDLRIKAERKAFRTAELSRLSNEYSDMIDRLQAMEAEKLSQEYAEESRQEWSSYKDPSDEPNAQNERDMNTFLSIMTDTKSHDLFENLDQIKHIERVAASMEDEWSNATSNLDVKKAKLALKYLAQFQTLCLQKLDTATVSCLRFVDNIINDRYEIQVEESAGDVSIGMWASYNDIRPIRKSVQFEKMGIQLDIPKQILQQESRFVHRIIRAPFDSYSKVFSDSNFNSKLGAYSLIGDVIYVDILISPPQAYALRAKKWVIRDNSTSSLSLRKSTYPSSVACRCFVKVPDYVVMSDDVRIALWNDETKEWTEDGLSDFQYTESNRLAQFYMTVVGVVALVKSRVVDMPYKKWLLQPIKPPSQTNGTTLKEESCARLTIFTQKTEIVIDILESICKLVRPNSKHCADLIGVALTPGQLISKLQKRGININPFYSDSDRMDENTAKNQDLEDDVLFAISHCASSMEFQNSSWNKELTSTQIGICGRESTLYTGGNDLFDFECILAEMDAHSESHMHAPEVGMSPGKAGAKYLLVLGNEYGDKKNYSLTPRPLEVSHADFLESLNSRLTPEGRSRILRGNERFHLTVYTLLRMIKPFSF